MLKTLFSRLWAILRCGFARAAAAATPATPAPATTPAELAAAVLRSKSSQKASSQECIYFTQKMLLRALGATPLAAINERFCHQLFERLAARYRPATVRLLAARLREILSLAHSRGLIAREPSSALRLNFAPARAKALLNPRQIAQILRHASGELAAFVRIALFTGARAGEVLALRASDIRARSREIIISKTALRTGGASTPKSNRTRRVYLCSQLAEYLKNINFNGFSSDYFQIRRQFMLLCERLRLPKCGLHALRHAYASYAAAAKMPLELIAEQLGHASTQTLVRTYLHAVATPAQLRKINKMYQI